jgi:hypothetical protein
MLQARRAQAPGRNIERESDKRKEQAHCHSGKADDTILLEVPEIREGDI